MGFEIAGKELERALDGRAGHGDEIAETFTFVKGEHLAELLEDRLAALPLLNFFQQGRERIRFHSTGGALTAGFDGKELGNL